MASDSGRFNNGNKTSMMFNLTLEHNLRLAFYERAWKFYKGVHWNQARPEDESYVTINYCRKFIDKHVNFLFGKGIKISIPDDPSTTANETTQKEFIKNALDAAWEANNQQELLFEIGQAGGVTGDAFLRVSWKDADGIDAGYPRIDVLPSEYVFPAFGGPYGVDRKTVNSILVIYPRYTHSSNPFHFLQGRGSITPEIEIYAELWYPDRVEIYNDLSRSYGATPNEVRRNPLGEIPIVHIRNYPLAGEYYGISDLCDVISLQVELNEKATDVSDVINYHGSPLTVVTGASIANIERGANKMIGLPESGKIENLELSGDLTASTNYLKMLKTALHEIGSVPEGVLGTVQKVGDESGAAVAMRYMPLTEVRNVKIQTYGKGLRQANRLIIKMLDLMDDAFHDEFSKLGDSPRNYVTNVTFPDPIPRDEGIQLSNDEKRLGLGLTSRRHVLTREGKSRHEIDEIFEEVERDRAEDAERDFKLGQGFAGSVFDDDEEPNPGSGNPNPVRPNPDAQGEKVSITAQAKALSGVSE